MWKGSPIQTPFPSQKNPLMCMPWLKLQECRMAADLPPFRPEIGQVKPPMHNPVCQVLAWHTFTMHVGVFATRVNNWLHHVLSRAINNRYMSNCYGESITRLWYCEKSAFTMNKLWCVIILRIKTDEILNLWYNQANKHQRLNQIYYIPQVKWPVNVPDLANTSCRWRRALRSDAYILFQIQHAISDYWER